tara:strand:+ start:325 stop:678 length:354 start_codon:yes stop_codon:yes gene_type:complete
MTTRLEKKKFSNEIVKSFEMFGNLLIHKYSLDLQTLGNFELDIDMKPGTWIYISRFENRNTLKINDSSQDIFFKHTWTQEKKFFVENGLSTLLNFSVFTFFEYQKIICKEFKLKENL